MNESIFFSPLWWKVICNTPGAWFLTKAEGRWPTRWFETENCKMPRVHARVCVCVCQSLSCVWLFVTPWTVAHQAALSVGFSRQEYWSGLLFSSPGIFPTQGLNPGLLDCRRVLYCLSHCGSPWEGCLLKGRLGASARKSSHCQKQTPLFHKVSKSMNEKEEGTNYSDIKTLNILVVFFSYPVFIYLLSISIFHTTAFS